MSFIPQNPINKITENRIMALLLVFFPEHNSTTQTKSLHNHTNNNVHQNLSSSSSHFTPNSLYTLMNYNKTNTNNSTLLLSKAQSTISICAFLVFLTFLFFTLSTFEPTIPSTKIHTNNRRFLSSRFNTSSSHFFNKLLNQNPDIPSFALNGMGTMYMRGTKAMNDLLVAHLVEDVTENQLRSFLRLLHRSGFTSKADTLFVFPSSLHFSSRFDSVIREEDDSFLELVKAYSTQYPSTPNSVWTHFDATHFVKRGRKKEWEEPLWGNGKKRRLNITNETNVESGNEIESTRLSYGSVLGFEVNELDPEESLSGFLDHVPMSLRRWACYPMLLGRLRRNFKHILLADVKNSLIIGDPLSRVRNGSLDSVHLSFLPNKHTRKNSEKMTQWNSTVNSGILMGGAKGIRRLSNAMLTELVRAATQHKKKKNSVSDSTVLSQLVNNRYITKNINLVRKVSSESLTETSSMFNMNSNSSLIKDHGIIPRGLSNHDSVYSIIMKQICSLEVDSSVYRDC